MDELGLFFKAPADRGLVVKTKKIEGDKKIKTTFDSNFCVAEDGSQVTEPTVIWESKFARSFKGTVANRKKH